jgi:hypothetical protein
MTPNEYRRMEARADANAGGSFEEIAAAIVELLDEALAEPVTIAKVACLRCRGEYYTVATRVLGCPWCRRRTGGGLDHCRLCLKFSAVYADALCPPCIGKHFVGEERR